MFYGRFVERVFAPDRRPTPSMVLRDGVDFIPMKTWKATMIQLLNIAGTGPIFGALMGARFRYCLPDASYRRRCKRARREHKNRSMGLAPCGP